MAQTDQPEENTTQFDRKSGNGARISDGVHQATVPASDVFPYLAPPNSGGPQLGDLAKLVRPQAEAHGGAR